MFSTTFGVFTPGQHSHVAEAPSSCLHTPLELRHSCTETYLRASHTHTHTHTHTPELHFWNTSAAHLPTVFTTTSFRNWHSTQLEANFNYFFFAHTSNSTYSKNGEGGGVICYLWEHFTSLPPSKKHTQSHTHTCTVRHKWQECVCVGWNQSDSSAEWAVWWAQTASLGPQQGDLSAEPAAVTHPPSVPSCVAADPRQRTSMCAVERVSRGATSWSCRCAASKRLRDMKCCVTCQKVLRQLVLWSWRTNWDCEMLSQTSGASKGIIFTVVIIVWPVCLFTYRTRVLMVAKYEAWIRERMIEKSKWLIKRQHRRAFILMKHVFPAVLQASGSGVTKLGASAVHMRAVTQDTWAASRHDPVLIQGCSFMSSVNHLELLEGAWIISLLKHFFDWLLETTGLNCLMRTVKTRPTGIIVLQAALNLCYLTTLSR